MSFRHFSRGHAGRAGRAVHAASFASLVLMALGCSPSTRSPRSTAHTFAQALHEQDYARAYALMADSYRAEVSFEAFRRWIERHPAEARQAAKRLSGVREPAQIHAGVPTADGDEVPLLWTRDGWRISRNIVQFYDQSTPRAAIRSFVDALARRRADVVLRFVPNADRQQMTEEALKEAWKGPGEEELERLIANLRTHLDNPIERTEDRATMPYGDRYAVQLILEDGVWKIEDAD